MKILFKTDNISHIRNVLLGQLYVDLTIILLTTDLLWKNFHTVLPTHQIVPKNFPKNLPPNRNSQRVSVMRARFMDFMSVIVDLLHLTLLCNLS